MQLVNEKKSASGAPVHYGQSIKVSAWCLDQGGYCYGGYGGQSIENTKTLKVYCKPSFNIKAVVYYHNSCTCIVF